LPILLIANEKRGAAPVKTPLLSKFERQLELVNDQMCFSAFYQWEFNQDLIKIVQSNPEDFTTSAFPKNPFSPSIYRRIKDLPSFAKEAEQVAIRMGFVASVEFCLAYMSEVQDLKEKFEASSADAIVHDAEEEQLRRKMKVWIGGNTFQGGYLTTLGYFRLLRNHYAHANLEPHKSLVSYSRANSEDLDKFWDNGITDVKGVRFDTLLELQPSPEQAFGLLNMIRVSLRQIDNAIAKTFTLQSILKHAACTRSRAIISGRTIPVLARKFRQQLVDEWSLEIDTSKVAQELTSLRKQRLL
jgi:hypothetical protein